MLFRCLRPHWNQNRRRKVEIASIHSIPDRQYSCWCFWSLIWKKKRKKTYFIYCYYIYAFMSGGSLPYRGDFHLWKSSSPWVPVTHDLERQFQEVPHRNIHPLRSILQDFASDKSLTTPWFLICGECQQTNSL